MKKSIIALAVAALIAVPNAASATQLLSSGDEPGIVDLGTGTATADYSEQTLAELRGLVGVQTQEQIEAVKQLGEGTSVLVGESGEELAAVHHAPEVKRGSRAVSWVGPGCTTTSLCFRSTTGIYYGYVGTGTLGVSLGNIYSVAAGDRTTKVKTATGASQTVRATMMIYFLYAQTITSISR